MPRWRTARSDRSDRQEIARTSRATRSHPRSPRRPGPADRRGRPTTAGRGGHSVDREPKCDSTQAWKRVPNRAARDGGRGMGRASSAVNASGSTDSRSTAVAERVPGSSTVCSPERASTASVSSRSMSASQPAMIASSSSSSAGRSTRSYEPVVAKRSRASVTHCAASIRRLKPSGSRGAGHGRGSTATTSGLCSAGGPASGPSPALPPSLGDDRLQVA